MEYEVTNYVGVDISMDTFDFHTEEGDSGKLVNKKKGFKQLEYFLDEGSCIVMEATSAYHQRLAVYLYEQGYMVAVLNPLVVNRYIQMKLKRNKTDKSDAMMICHYACDQGVELWEPLPAHVEECRSMMSLVDIFLKQRTQLKNKLHYLKKRGEMERMVAQMIKEQIETLKQSIDELEDEILSILQQEEGELVTCLKSIPGMGPKTIMSLIVNTNAFSGFENAKQLSSYIGIAPTERSSGKSVMGSGRISKRGNPKVRYHMFMCAFTAYKCNPQCKALYERIVNKGKSKKLALVAVANKLLKQAFAISQSRIPYDPKYKGIKPA